MQNLQNRGLDISAVCPACKWEVETSLYALWSYKSLKSVRKSWQMSMKIGKGKGQSFMDFVLNCFGILHARNRFLLHIVLWWLRKVAILRGIQLAFDTGLVLLDMVYDVAMVVAMVNDMRNHASKIGLIVDAIRDLMLALPCNVLMYAPRSTNLVARTLAKNALSVSKDRVWLKDFPYCVRKALLTDASRCI
ncbi:hypothetical protein Dsin_020937 [Dipteronia sinensis]|uniref:RNase H type-1 domain-containing protein n=1 Tax=Dipteronia sinensis TaxID=43782 RepID=A0AAE0E4G1_9ROSI|nr:hypothetical protein Dsin_020937 [Dipteronia sinensis]